MNSNSYPTIENSSSNKKKKTTNKQILVMKRILKRGETQNIPTIYIFKADTKKDFL